MIHRCQSLPAALRRGRVILDAAWQPPADADGIAGHRTPPHTDDADAHPAILLRTSGSTGSPRWVGLSSANIFAVLESHREALALDGAVVLSVLPWHHAFGLVLGLLAALRDANEIVVARALLADQLAIRNVIRDHPITHVDLVPALVERWTRCPEGSRLLRSACGVVGGAPVTVAVCDALRGSRFRIGYGQTEASPGIMLGPRGAFAPALLGSPVGCDVKREPDGELWFRGPNACHGKLHGDQYTRSDPTGWRSTGDRVQQRPDGTWEFLGRHLPAFKLRNGRYLDALMVEHMLRERCACDDVAVLDDRLGGFVVAASGAGVQRDVGLITRELGALAQFCARIHIMASADWPRTSKGSTDHRALRDRLIASAQDTGAPTGAPRRGSV